MNPSFGTMSVAEMLASLAEGGVELWFEGDRLRFRAPKGALSPEQRATVSSRRDEVLDHLRAEAAAKNTTFPLSFSQQSLWFLHQQAPDSTAYHLAMSTRILSGVDVASLRHAVQAIVDRHAILRTTYRIVDGSPAQQVAGYVSAGLEVHDVPGITDAELRELALADVHRPFDLECGPILRAALYTRGPVDHVLLISVHHIAVDGWSLFLLFEELGRFYAEAAGVAPAGLTKPAVSYADYSAWQRELLASDEGERMWRYWRDKLAPPRSPLNLRGDRPLPAGHSRAGASFPVAIGAPLTERLREIARQEGTTSFVVVLATFHAFLSRLAGVDDVIVGTPTFARSKAEFMTVIGDFVNSVPIRAALPAGTTFRDLVVQLRQTVHEALDAQELPLPLLVQRLSPERDAGRSPLFDTFLVFQRFDQFRDVVGLLTETDPPTTVDVGGLRMTAFPLPQQEGQFDLTLQLLERGSDVVGAFNYRTEIFDEATIRQFSSDYVRLIEAVAENPALPIADLPGAALARRACDLTALETSELAKPSAADETIERLLDEFRARDIRLFLDGGKLRVNAPKGAVTDAMKSDIAENKEAIIAALQRTESVATDAAARATIRRIPRDGRLPLSSAQQRLWFLDRMEPGTPRYNISATVWIYGPLAPDVLRRAVAEVVERHEGFRTRIADTAAGPEIEISDAAAVPLEFVDVSHVPLERRDSEARRAFGERLRAPIDLYRGPLGRFLLIRLSDEKYLFGLVAHHIVSDGWSLMLAVRETTAAYELLASKQPVLPGVRGIDYVDYAAWEQDRIHSGQIRSQLDYWRRELAGAPAVIELPTDRPRSASPSPRGHRLTLSVDSSLLDPLKHVGRQHDATFFMVLLAAFQVVLHRWAGQDDVVVGTPVANRSRPELEGIVGCFVNNLALRGRLGGNPTFAEVLAATKQTVLGAFDHAEVPFDLIVDAVRHDRAAAQTPLFQILLTLHSFDTTIAAPQGLRYEHGAPIDLGTTRFDIALEMAEVEGTFTAMYEYSTDLFDPETITRLHVHFGRVLRTVVENPTTRIEDLPLLDAADERMLLDQWNATSIAHDRTRCVHQLLESSARISPDATAVVAGESSLTYRELDQRANQVAHLLVRRGVPPGSLVAVCVDRTLDMPIAIAAVLKSGAAYVPLDPTHPAERLRDTLDDAAVACVITTSRFASLLADVDAPVVSLDQVGAELSAMPTTPVSVNVAPDDRAYVIYTSGSTGRPKGVEVEHRNVVAFLEAMRREPGFTSNDTLLAVTTLSFDIAGLEFWLPLSVGGKVVIASRAEVLDGERLIAMIARHAVTVMQATPATWRLLLDAGWAGNRKLKVLCGGEALPRDLAADLVPRVGELWNMYGPTETTIWSTVSHVDDAAAPITIGRPIANTRIYILEASGQPAPIGVAGELCIGGEGVARGYHDRPELTAEKFVTITLPGGRSERVYRTGDLARYRADGRIDFLGRRDQQVKVRGYRIELGEIEAVLATHPGITESVTAVREIAPGDHRIVAYVVLAAGSSFDTDAVRATLRERLPEYMIPSIFTTLAALPLTPNGKIDRKVLPAPHVADRPAAPSVSELMMTPVQRRVAAVWRDVLRTDRVGLHDNFFDIGGHSLLLVRLHADLKREFGAGIELVELFQWTTVAAQANRLSVVAAPNDALKRAQARAARQINE